jgi:hypothetical protein
MGLCTYGPMTEKVATESSAKCKGHGGSFPPCPNQLPYELSVVTPKRNLKPKIEVNDIRDMPAAVYFNDVPSNHVVAITAWRRRQTAEKIIRQRVNTFSKVPIYQEPLTNPAIVFVAQPVFTPKSGRRVIAMVFVPLARLPALVIVEPVFPALIAIVMASFVTILATMIIPVMTIAVVAIMTVVAVLREGPRPG